MASPERLVQIAPCEWAYARLPLRRSQLRRVMLTVGGYPWFGRRLLLSSASINSSAACRRSWCRLRGRKDFGIRCLVTARGWRERRRGRLRIHTALDLKNICCGVPDTPSLHSGGGDHRPHPGFILGKIAFEKLTRQKKARPHVPFFLTCPLGCHLCGGEADP